MHAISMIASLEKLKSYGFVTAQYSHPEKVTFDISNRNHIWYDYYKVQLDQEVLSKIIKKK